MAIAWLLMLVELAVELIYPLLMAIIIDQGIVKKDLDVVLKWGVFMLALSLLAFLAGIINSFFAAHVSQHFAYDVRESLFKKIQAFSFSNLNRFPTSSFITRMTNDVTQVQNTVFMSLRIMLRAPLLVLGGAIMALFVNVKLALVLIAFIPLLVAFLIWMMKKGGAMFKKVQQQLDAVNSVMQENLTGMRLIKAFIRRKHEENRFIKTNQALRDQTITALRVVETTMPVLLFFMNVSILAVLWLGSNEVNNGEILVGEIVAIVNYGFRMTAALSILTFVIMAFSRARASSQRISEVLTTEIDLVDDEKIQCSPTITSGKVEFREVSFRYPDHSSSVLQNVSFRAPAGKKLAILGATGSGKSSLVQLIPRLYDVDHGTILIDDVDIRGMKLADLRKQIGFVPQETILFSGTIKENIGWGKEDASLEDIIEAAEKAQIHHTIVQMPDQYETVLGQKGVNLSGGQKQRLSIARALVRKPKLLILDDSTSALDLKTEAALLEALDEDASTLLIITQKMSTAMNAEMILLLENGQLIAKGNHHELMAHSPLYQRIYQSQFGQEELVYGQ